MKISNPKDKIFTTVLIVAVLGAMIALEMTCPIRTVLHICCPGCGMTRAYFSLLHGDIRQAFSYHAMFWSVPIIYLMYLFDEKLFKQRWLNVALTALIGAGWLANWIYRLFCPI